MAAEQHNRPETRYYTHAKLEKGLAQGQIDAKEEGLAQGQIDAKALFVLPVLSMRFTTPRGEAQMGEQSRATVYQ